MQSSAMSSLESASNTNLTTATMSTASSAFSNLPAEITERIAENLDQMFALRLVSRDTAAKVLRAYKKKHYSKAVLPFGDVARMQTTIVLTTTSGDLMKCIKSVILGFDGGRGEEADLARFSNNKEFQACMVATWFCQLKAIGAKVQHIHLVARAAPDITLSAKMAWLPMMVVEAVAQSRMPVSTFESQLCLPVDVVLETPSYLSAWKQLVGNLTSLEVRATIEKNKTNLDEDFVEILTTSPTLRHVAPGDGFWFRDDNTTACTSSPYRALLATKLPNVQSLLFVGFMFNVPSIVGLKDRQKSLAILTLEVMEFGYELPLSVQDLEDATDAEECISTLIGGDVSLRVDRKTQRAWQSMFD